MRRVVAVLVSAMIAATACGAIAADLSAWAKGTDRDGKTRFIPVELWTGSPWNGERVIGLPKANLTFGKRSNKSVAGPFEWKRPDTGEALMVYERRSGATIQLFTLRKDKTGLGRVYDSRYPRECVDAIKFPLGIWRQGETRRYEFSCNQGTKIRTVELTIEEIDFVFSGVPHSLRFRWIVDGGKGAGTHMVYTYSPLKGLVHLVEN